MSQPLRVTLPCCPVCSRVGKMPGDVYAGKTWCVGRSTGRHKRTQMQPREFVEAREPGRSVYPAPISEGRRS